MKVGSAVTTIGAIPFKLNGRIQHYVCLMAQCLFRVNICNANLLSNLCNMQFAALHSKEVKTRVCFTNIVVITISNDLPQLSLLRRHSLTVRNNTTHNKTDYLSQCQDLKPFRILKSHYLFKNQAILTNGWNLPIGEIVSVEGLKSTGLPCLVMIKMYLKIIMITIIHFLVWIILQYTLLIMCLINPFLYVFIALIFGSSLLVKSYSH